MRRRECQNVDVARCRSPGSAWRSSRRPLLYALPSASFHDVKWPTNVPIDFMTPSGHTHGYDIRAEIVGERGAVALADADQVRTAARGRRGG